jgi:AraC-like DNA-binding protein
VFKIFCCFGQSDIKLYKQKENILKTIEYKDTNLDSLLYYSKKVQNSDNDCDNLSGLNSEAYYYYKIKDFDKSKNLALKTIQKIDNHLANKKEEVCFIKIKLSLLNRLFWIYRNKGAYDEAYKQLIKTSLFLKSIKNSGFDKFFYVINNELSKSQIKYELELEKDAKIILNNLVKDIETKKVDFKNLFYKKAFFRKQADIYNSLGKTYITLSKTENNLTFLDSASICFEKAYNAALKFTPPHPDSKLNYQFRQTEVLISKKEYEKALGLINSYSYPKSIDSIDTFSFQETAFYKSICYNSLNKSDSAIYYAKKAVRKNGLKESQVITMYDILSNQYIKKNKLDSAYKYSQLTLKQFNLAKENKYKTYQLLYDNDIEKITELNNSIVAKEKKKNLTNLLFYSVILLSISSLFLFKRKKYKKEISEKSDELKSTIVNAKKDLEKEKSQSKKTIGKPKVNYNIEAQLEEKILDQIKQIEINHTFLKHDFSINTIAEKVNTNSTYVSFVYNKHYDVPFKQYYTQKKIEYAVDLIKNKEYYKKYSIEGLANIVGYTNASAFSRAFKKYMNVSPSEYIKNLRK